MKIRIILLVALTLLFCACAAPATPQPIDIAISTDEIGSLSEPTLPPVEATPSPAMATYTDDLAGFSLDYPANWFLESSVLIYAEESLAYTIYITSWDMVNAPTPSAKDGYALPDGATKLDVTVVKQTLTMDEVIAQQNETGNPIAAQKDVTLAGGLPGVILDAESFGVPVRTLIATINGNTLYVTGFGNLENFEAIALTVRAK